MENTENVKESPSVSESVTAAETDNAPDRTEQVPSQVRNGSGAANEDQSCSAGDTNEIADSLRLRAAAEERVRMGSEIESLLYTLPDADLRKITPEGWEKVRAGESLLCTYLLCEREERATKAANDRTVKNSTGALPTGKDESYTMDEIRRMDRSSVRKNLDKVMRSLSAGGKRK